LENYAERPTSNIEHPTLNENYFEVGRSMLEIGLGNSEPRWPCHAKTVDFGRVIWDSMELVADAIS
jgi:hypothetical protein